MPQHVLTSAMHKNDNGSYTSPSTHLMLSLQAIQQARQPDLFHAWANVVVEKSQLRACTASAETSAMAKAEYVCLTLPAVNVVFFPQNLCACTSSAHCGTCQACKVARQLLIWCCEMTEGRAGGVGGCRWEGAAQEGGAVHVAGAVAQVLRRARAVGRGR